MPVLFFVNFLLFFFLPNNLRQLKWRGTSRFDERQRSSPATNRWPIGLASIPFRIERCRRRHGDFLRSGRRLSTRSSSETLRKLPLYLCLLVVMLKYLVERVCTVDCSIEHFTIDQWSDSVTFRRKYLCIQLGEVALLDGEFRGARKTVETNAKRELNGIKVLEIFNKILEKKGAILVKSSTQLQRQD